MCYIFYCVLRLDFMALYKSYFIVVLLPVYIITYYYHWPSVLWGCWLGDRKGIRPVKNWVVGCWRGYLSERGADLHMTQLMPLPLTISCFSKIQIGFTFQVPGHPGSLGKRAVKRVCVYYYLWITWSPTVSVTVEEYIYSFIHQNVHWQRT